MPSTKSRSRIEYIDQSKKNAETKVQPDTPLRASARQAILESLRPRLVELIIDVHIESLRVGGPEDPFEAAWNLTCDELAATRESLRFRAYAVGIQDALGLTESEVLDVARGHVHRIYPTRLIRYINRGRKRRRLPLLPTSYELPTAMQRGF